MHREKRFESVAVVVCLTIGGTQELQTPDVIMDDGIMGIWHQMANQCLSWKTKTDLCFVS